MMITVSQLITYPLKSASGVDITTMEITARGPQYDRMCMLVDAKGRFISQRDFGCEIMATIDCLVFEDGCISFSGEGALADVFVVKPHEFEDGVIDVSVHGNECWGHVCQNDSVTQFFNDYLGRDDVRLIKYAESQPRKVVLQYAQEGDEVSYADGLPILLTSTSSLQSLTENCELSEFQKIDMSRFRPNIVLDGLPAWQEDVIHKVKIGDSLVLEFMKPCERCGVPAIDQDTGKVQSGVDVKDREPIRTLRSYRFGADKESGLKGAFFGQSATPRTLGTISVGDEVEILEERAVHPALAEVKLGYGG